MTHESAFTNTMHIIMVITNSLAVTNTWLQRINDDCKVYILKFNVTNNCYNDHRHGNHGHN